MSKKNKPVRGKSIARRLNAALTRRSFAKTLLIDLLAVIVVMVTWCLTVENTNGGMLFNVRSRSFTGSCDVIYNTVQCGRDIVRYYDELRMGIRPDGNMTLPFYGVYYKFTIVDKPADTATETVLYETEAPAVDYEILVEETMTDAAEEPIEVTESDETEVIPEVQELILYAEEPDVDYAYTVEGETVRIYSTDDPIPYQFSAAENGNAADRSNTIIKVSGERVVLVDASVILTIVTACFIVLFVLQVLSAVIKSLSGGGLIKRYLRPIDDIALMAEQLSSESYTASEEEVRAAYKSDINSGSDVEQNEPVLDMHDVESFTDAIDEIEDSRARIDMHAPELSGLEAAVNNMLKRLEESRRKQIRFVDDASHELRTPIAVIQGYANMLDRWGKDDPKVRDEAIEAIKNEAEHIKTLLDQLLFLARGEMDRHVLELKPLSVDEILAEIVEESQMLDRQHNYELTLASGNKNLLAEPMSEEEKESLDFKSADSRVKDMQILGDAAMMKQSIRILCDNSVRYTPEGGTITLKSGERVSVDDRGKVRREVCIEVSDTGIGISADELPRIFDRFYRGENARSDNTGGSGLGLSIARWIIEQHHGRIEAISSPGIGTKMTIILPAYEAPEEK